MYLHEYQSKNLFSLAGLNIPKFFLVKKRDDVFYIEKFFTCEYVYCKVQIHSGYRKKNGGVVKLKNDYKCLLNFISDKLEKMFFLNEENSTSKFVSSILVEEPIDIYKEFYVSFSIDRKSQGIILLVSSFGGVDVELSNNFFKLEIDLLLGIKDYQVRSVLCYFNLSKIYYDKFRDVLFKFFRIFLENDLMLLEINPLVLSSSGDFICLDAKIEVDDNSLYRHKYLRDIFDESQIDLIELKAEKYGLSYVSLSGDIGCIVNGAGLAMFTMDSLIRGGGKPANFLDIGGDATKVKVLAAFELLLHVNVKSIFINIFGGIVKCDLIALCILEAVDLFGIKVPIIIRLAGNCSKEGMDIIKSSGLGFFIETDFNSAINKVIELSK